MNLSIGNLPVGIPRTAIAADLATFDTYHVATSSLAERLALALAHAGKSQTEIEQAARLGEGYLSRPLRGERKRLDPSNLIAIAGACGVSFEWLAGGTGTMTGADNPIRAVTEPLAAMKAGTERLAEIDSALMSALDKRRHTFADVATVSDLLVRTWDSDEDLSRVGGRMLDAAAEARRDGRQVTPEHLATILARHLAATSGTHLERDERYPNRAAAIAYHRGKVSPRAVELLREHRLEGPDLEPEEWWKELQKIQKQIDKAGPKPSRPMKPRART